MKNHFIQNFNNNHYESKSCNGIKNPFWSILSDIWPQQVLGFMPFPESPGDGGALMGIYATSGFMKVIGVLEILGGLALLPNEYLPLAWTFLVDIMLFAFLFLAPYDMTNIGGAVLGLVLGLLLVCANKGRFSD